MRFAHFPHDTIYFWRGSAARSLDTHSSPMLPL
jgi:hypothetical protein